ncbi:MAG: 2-dehydropantoate 2-reductase [Limisphaerales bacterium]|jgi:2-dehydropantoate 2-reductase
MRYVIYGAGAIGGTVGARLFQVGKQVTLISRGAHGRAMQDNGLTLYSPSGRDSLRIDVALAPADVAKLNADDVAILLCMKSQHTEAALRELVSLDVSAAHIVCMQNGVANEREALRYFPNVYGAVVNLPATHLLPGEVITHAEGYGGILDTGCYPLGCNSVCEQINSDLSDAGFSAKPQPHIMRYKFAKLLLNLGNVLQAGLGPDADMGEIGRRLRREALACYAAAGIDCANKTEVAERSRGVYRMGVVEGAEHTAGSSWQSLERGNHDIETEFLNGEICLLGRQHGVVTPANDACVKMGRALLKRGGKPGVISVQEFESWL